MKVKASMSLATLTYMNSEVLREILSDKDYDEETKGLARRVLNARGESL